MVEREPALLPLLRSDNQLRLLGVLFLEPTQGFTITELARKTGVPQPSVSREIARLSRNALVTAREHRGQKEYTANPEHLLFPELASMLLKTVGPKTVLEAALGGLAGIEHAYIYGSWARRCAGEAGEPPRDIDLLVVGTPEVRTVRKVTDTASERLGCDVNPTVLTRREWAEAKSGFLRQIKASALVELDLSS